jgi:ribosomal protein S18 acetylase RimI-like enzyme
METDVRRARRDELEVVQRLNQGSFVNDRAHDPYLDMAWPLDPDTGGAYFLRRIEGDGICLVAEQDAVIVGYLAGSMTPIESYRHGRRAELENMYVAATVRRRGVGAALVAEFERWGRTQGADEVFVSAYAGNERALDFYRACGFAPYAQELLFDLRDRRMPE